MLSKRSHKNDERRPGKDPSLRSLRKKGYNQMEIEHLFQSLVLPKIYMHFPVLLMDIC